MKENEKITENENLINKDDSSKSIAKKNMKNSTGSDFTLFFYLLLIMIVFGVLVFLFFYIHYGSYKIDLLVAENSISFYFI